MPSSSQTTSATADFVHKTTLLYGFRDFGGHIYAKRRLASHHCISRSGNRPRPSTRVGAAAYSLFPIPVSRLRSPPPSDPRNNSHKPVGEAQGPITFEDVVEASGVDFQLKNSISPQRYSIETMMDGVAYLTTIMMVCSTYSSPMEHQFPRWRRSRPRWGPRPRRS